MGSPETRGDVPTFDTLSREGQGHVNNAIKEIVDNGIISADDLEMKRDIQEQLANIQPGAVIDLKERARPLLGKDGKPVRATSDERGIEFGVNLKFGGE
jgi:hypothetical protein